MTGIASFTLPVRVHYEDTDSAGIVYPARLHDLLIVETTLTKMGRVSMWFTQQVKSEDGQICYCEGILKLGSVNQQLKPIRIPDCLKKKLLGKHIRG